MRPPCRGPLNNCESARKTDGLELGTSSPASLAGPQPPYRHGSDSLSRPQHGMLEGSDDPVFFLPSDAGAAGATEDCRGVS